MSSKIKSALDSIGQVQAQQPCNIIAYERVLARFAPDDDEPRCPDVDALSSAQSRRLPVEVH
jgi:hypothetical protein